MQNNYILRPLIGTALILLVPLIAMQFEFSDIDPGGGAGGVNWTLSDFVVMGALLFITGCMLELAWRKTGKYRVIAMAGIAFAFLWLWAELAVGVFTNWGS